MLKIFPVKNRLIKRFFKKYLLYNLIFIILFNIVFPSHVFLSAQEASDSAAIITPTSTPSEIPTPELSPTPSVVIPSLSPTPEEEITLTPTVLPSPPTPTVISPTISLPTATPTVSATPTVVPTILLEESSSSLNSATTRQPIKMRAVSKTFIQAKESFMVELLNSKDNPVTTSLTKEDINLTGFSIKQKTIGETTVLIVEPSLQFTPGKYKLKVTDAIGHTEEQDFLWGILAVNTNKSIYLPGETAKLAMAVLDERGRMVCDANLELRVKNEELKIDEILSTKNGKIIVNPECRVHGYTTKPDYEALFPAGGAGEYKMTLTAETKNGTFSIEDSFEVRENVLFEVERVTATRIYPPSIYPVTFNIKANEDFEGTMVETVPDSFNITPANDNNIKSYDSVETTSVTDKKENVLGTATGTLRLPFNNSYPITLAFGERPDDPNLQKEYESVGAAGHDGLDFGLPKNTPVLSVDEGEVVNAGKGDYGLTVVIKHNWGESFYGHLSGLGVEVGQKIAKGETIGFSGDTGIVTGPHLHFALLPRISDPHNAYLGKIDPAPYLGVSKEDNIVLVKNIIWNVSFKKGETMNLGYRYLAPNVSPQFYLLGSLRFYPHESASTNPQNQRQSVFNETRQWQIAADTTTITLSSASPGNNAGGATSLTINKPAGVVEGDVMVAQVTVRGGTGTGITAPTGWTLLDRNNSTTTLGQADYYRVAGSSEGASYQWNFSATQKASGGIIAYSGVAEDSPIDNNGAAHGGKNSVSGTGVTAPSITTVTANAMLVGFFGTATGTTFTNAVLTEEYDTASTGGSAGTRCTSEGADGIQAVAGASGAKVATAAVAAVNIGQLLALRPGVIISGNVYEGEVGGFAWSGCDGSTTNISLSVNGGTKLSHSCDASTGAFSFTVTNPAAANQVIVVYMDTAGGDKGVLYTKNNDTTSNITGLTLIKNRVWIQSESAQTITNANINTYDQTQDTDIPAASDGINLIVNSGSEIHINTGDTFAPGGNVTTDAMHVMGTYSGNTETLDFKNQGTGATCTAGTGTMRPLCVDGGTFTAPTTTNFTTALGAANIEGTTYKNLGVGISAEGGSGITFTLAGNTIVNTALTVGSADSTNSDTLAGSTYTLTLSGTGTVFSITAKGAFQDDTSTVAYTGNNTTTVAQATYYDLQVKPGADGITHTLAAGITKVDRDFTSGNGTNTGVTVDASANPTTLDIDGSFSNSASTTFKAHASNSFTVAKNFTNNGTFNANAGTITLDTANAAVFSYAAAISFAGFTVNTPSKEIDFPAGTTYRTNITGALNINGGACGTKIKLYSASASSQYEINATAAVSIDYVDIKDSKAITALTASHAKNSNNNTGWTFASGCGATTDQLMRHGKWFDSSGARQPFTF